MGSSMRKLFLIAAIVGLSALLIPTSRGTQAGVIFTEDFESAHRAQPIDKLGWTNSEGKQFVVSAGFQRASATAGILGGSFRKGKQEAYIAIKPPDAKSLTCKFRADLYADSTDTTNSSLGFWDFGNVACLGFSNNQWEVDFQGLVREGGHEKIGAVGELADTAVRATISVDIENGTVQGFVSDGMKVISSTLMTINRPNNLARIKHVQFFNDLRNNREGLDIDNITVTETRAVVAEAKAPESEPKWSVTASDHQRRMIYHSPQTPGFTSWTGTWLTPEDELMVVLTQATGPIEGRARGPKDVLEKLSWPPPGLPKYDMTGLDMRNIYLRSTDIGETWNTIAEDPFVSPLNGVSSGEGHLSLPDGTILRGVTGMYLPYNPELPQTGFLQRSTDAGKTWGAPEVYMDPKQYTTYSKRLRLLADGRLVMLGGLTHAPLESLDRSQHNDPGLFESLFMVSEDDGKTWTRITIVPPEHITEWDSSEYDVAELPNGDLLCVFRRLDPETHKTQVRWQGYLKKTGKTWVPDAKTFRPAVFAKSGHPELLATREGVILHIATTGVHWTVNAGQSWHRLNVPPTRYYPTSVQTPDGTICIFAHVGGDDPYGKRDQSIVMDSFRLKVVKPK